MSTWVAIVISACCAGWYVYSIWKLSLKNRDLDIQLQHARVEAEVWREKAMSKVKPSPNYPLRSKQSWVPKAERPPSPDEIASVYASLGVALPPSLKKHVAQKDKEREDVIGNLLRDLEALEPKPRGSKEDD